MILADKYEKSRIQFDIQSDIWQLGFNGSRSEWLGVVISASKSSIRRFVITEKAPTRAFSWLKAATQL